MARRFYVGWRRPWVYEAVLFIRVSPARRRPSANVVTSSVRWSGSQSPRLETRSAGSSWRAHAPWPAARCHSARRRVARRDDADHNQEARQSDTPAPARGRERSVRLKFTSQTEEQLKGAARSFGQATSTLRQSINSPRAGAKRRASHEDSRHWRQRPHRNKAREQAPPERP